MDDQQRQHLKKLRGTYIEQLRVLEIKRAKFGLSVPVHVETQIVELESKIARIDEQFADSEESALQIPDKKIISILFLSADPIDAVHLRLGEELREIREKLQLARLRDRFVLEQRMSTRPTDIIQALLDVQPQIVHFSGHGTTTDALCFENESGKTHPIEPDALAALFEQFSDSVDCVLLNACYSETQANEIAQYIDYVIGMNQAISDKAAIAFAIGFYQGLGAGRTYEDSYELGCVQIRLYSIPEHLTPELIKRKWI